MQELKQLLKRQAISAKERMSIYTAVYSDQHVREQVMASNMDGARTAMNATVKRELQKLNGCSKQ